jgi:hypothetical protein
MTKSGVKQKKREDKEYDHPPSAWLPFRFLTPFPQRFSRWLRNSPLRRASQDSVPGPSLTSPVGLLRLRHPRHPEDLVPSPSASGRLNLQWSLRPVAGDHDLSLLCVGANRGWRRCSQGQVGRLLAQEREGIRVINLKPCHRERWESSPRIERLHLV